MTDNSSLPTPYQPPSQHAVTDLVMDADARKRRFWFRMIWVSVAGVVLPPILGVMGIVVGMTKAFGQLREVGAADPSALANDISIAMLSTLYSILISVPAFVFLIVSILRYRRIPKPA